MSARTLAPPPGPPDTLNTTLVVVVIVVGSILFCLLVGLVVYVCKLQRDFASERKASEDAKAMKLALLHEKRDAKESEMLDDLERRMVTLKQNYEECNIKHARFIKEHDPELFEHMKDTGAIVIAGDEVAEVVVEDERDIDAELKAAGISFNFTAEQKQDLLRNTEKTNKATALRSQIKELKKKQEARRKERALEDERLALEQRLLDLESEEKLDALKRLEKKQKERDEIDNMRNSKRLAITENGEYIISRMGGGNMEYDLEPYDSDFDFDDELPQLPAHLDDINPRGRILKKKLDETRHALNKDKRANHRRENEMERDMTLMRLRLAQQKRNNERRDRRRIDAAEAASGNQEDEMSRLGMTQGPVPNAGASAETKDANSPYTKDVPVGDHKPVPHFITAPWTVEGLEEFQGHNFVKKKKGGGGGRRRVNAHLLDFVADAMKDEEAQREALESGKYFEPRDASQSPLQYGLHPEALPDSAIPLELREKRLIL